MIRRRQQGRGMGDHDHRALLAQFDQGVAQFLLGLAIEAARRLVQQQRRRVSHQRPGDGDALPLAARQLPPRLADFRGVAVGQIDDEFVNTGSGGRFHDFLVGGVGMAVGDILPDRAGKEDALLGHVPDPIGQFGAGELGHVGAVHDDPAVGGFVEALEKLERRRLSAAVAPDDGVHAAGLDSETQVVDNRRAPFGIAEINVLQGELALGPVQFDLAFQAIALGIEQFAQAFHRLPEGRIRPPLGNKLVEGTEQAAAQHVGGDEGAHGQFLVDDGHGADAGQRYAGDQRQRGTQVGVRVRLASAVDGVGDVIGVGVLEHGAHGLIEGERLDGGPPVDDLGDQGVTVHAGAAFLAVGGPHDAGRAPGDEHEHRDHDQQHRRDGSGNDENQPEEENREGKIGDQHGGGAGKGVADHVDVAEQGLPVGRGFALENVQRQRHHLVEHLAADQHIDPERHRLHDSRARRTQDVVERQHQDHTDAQPLERADTAGIDHPVVDLQHEHRNRQGENIDKEGYCQNLAEDRLQRFQDRPEPCAFRWFTHRIFK